MKFFYLLSIALLFRQGAAAQHLRTERGLKSEQADDNDIDIDIDIDNDNDNDKPKPAKKVLAEIKKAGKTTIEFFTTDDEDLVILSVVASGDEFEKIDKVLKKENGKDFDKIFESLSEGKKAPSKLKELAKKAKEVKKPATEPAEPQVDLEEQGDESDETNEALVNHGGRKLGSSGLWGNWGYISSDLWYNYFCQGGTNLFCRTFAKGKAIITMSHGHYTTMYVYPRGEYLTQELKYGYRYCSRHWWCGGCTTCEDRTGTMFSTYSVPENHVAYMSVTPTDKPKRRMEYWQAIYDQPKPWWNPYYHISIFQQ